MRIGVIGGGVVGKATARAFLEHVDEVCIYDIDPTRRTTDRGSVVGCDIVFVCLPTPQKDDGSCDTSVLDEKFFDELHMWTPKRRENFVIRSTVPVGYTKRIAERFPNVVHSPEFLTARCADVDAQMPSRNIVGFPTGGFGDDHPLIQLYRKRWPHVPLLRMSSNSSELIKLTQNAFFAVKVAFWNEAKSLCDKLHVDYDTLIKGILLDGRIHPSHTKVPGPDGLRGFGGTCLPKDLASYVNHLHSADLSAWVAQSAMLRNGEDRP